MYLSIIEAFLLVLKAFFSVLCGVPLRLRCVSLVLLESFSQSHVAFLCVLCGVPLRLLRLMTEYLSPIEAFL